MLFTYIKLEKKEDTKGDTEKDAQEDSGENHLIIALPLDKKRLYSVNGFQRLFKDLYGSKNGFMKNLDPNLLIQTLELLHQEKKLILKVIGHTSVTMSSNWTNSSFVLVFKHR